MKKIKLGDLLTIKHGYAFKSEHYLNDGNFALVTLANISESNNFQFDKEKLTYYGASFPQDVILKEGDLILPMTEQVIGLLGNSAFIPAVDGFSFVLNQRVGKVIPSSNVDKYYLHYLLATKEVKTQLEYRASGTKQRNISPENIYDVTVLVPDLPSQKKIGSVLYSLEQKINLNKKINATLEAMAKTLYDYWFVQFDFPDEHGRPYKSSGGKMIYSSELGRDIPEGWQIKTLKDICKIVDCLHSQKPIRMYEQERCFLLQLENLISLGIIDLGYKYYVSESDYNTWTAKIEVCEGDLIITNAGRVGAFARVPKGIKAGIGRNITAIRPERVSSVYLYYYLHSVDNLRQIRKNIDVGAFFNSLNVKGLKQISVLIPPKNLMEFFTRNCEPYRYKLELAACESQQIVALRDWLLPLLMNEQVKFKEDKNE